MSEDELNRIPKIRPRVFVSTILKLLGLLSLSTLFAACSQPTPEKTLADVSKSLWADTQFGGCGQPANIMRITYARDKGLLVFHWRNGQIVQTISEPQQNAQKTEFEFPETTPGRSSFQYRERKYAEGNKPIEYMTGDPATLIYNLLQTVELDGKDRIKVTQVFDPMIDTRALFENRIVRYTQKKEVHIWERCH